MGSMGGGDSGSSQSTQTQDPWSGLQPYLLGQEGREATEGRWENVPSWGGDEESRRWIEGTPGQEAITGIFPEAGRLYGEGPSEFYGGQTYADFSGDTRTAQDMMRKRAMGGSELNRGAQDLSRRTTGGEFLGANPVKGYLDETASGGMLNANPYLDETFKRAAAGVKEQFTEATTPALASQYAKAGRYGSPSMGRAMEGARGELGETLSGMATDIYGGNYQRERDRQMGAAGQIGSAYAGERGLQARAMEGSGAMARGDYLDMGMLRSVGQETEGMDQNAINEAMARHDFEQGSEWDNLNRFNSLMTGNSYGGSTTSSRPWFGASQGSNIAGGISTGLGAYGMMGATNPYLAAGMGLMSMF